MSKKESGKRNAKRRSSRRSNTPARSLETIAISNPSVLAEENNTSESRLKRNDADDRVKSGVSYSGASMSSSEDAPKGGYHEESDDSSDEDSGGEWIIDGSPETATFNFSTPYQESYELIVPAGSSTFIVNAPADSQIEEIELTADASQLAGAEPFSVFAGLENGENEFKLINSDLANTAIIADASFTEFYYIKELELKGLEFGFELTLAEMAQGAGIIEVEGSEFADIIDASAYTVGIEIDGETGEDDIKGGSKGDKLKGEDDSDAIVGNDGADFYIGGKGADTLDLSDTDDAIDTVVYESRFDGSAAGVAGGTFSGFDVVTGFDVVDADKVLFKFQSTAKVTGSVASVIPAFDFTDVDAVVAELAGSIPAGSAPGATILYALNDGTNTAVYAALLSATGDVVASGVTYLAEFIDAQFTL